MSYETPATKKKDSNFASTRIIVSSKGIEIFFDLRSVYLKGCELIPTSFDVLKGVIGSGIGVFNGMPQSGSFG